MVLTLDSETSTRWRLLPGVALVAAFLSAPTQPLHAQGAGEADLKAALVYNFALFTEWETGETEAAGRPFTICYVGPEMAAAFASIAAKSIRARTIALRAIPTEGPYEGCGIAYWHDGNARRALPEKAGHGVLTIGIGAEFLQRGGMIEMHVEEARIVFSINAESARRAGMRFSSKLLRLAKNVTGMPQ